MNKRFNELSEQEVLSLTDAEIDNLINLECAEQGVKLMRGKNAPSEPLYYEMPKADIRVFELLGLVFKSRDECEKVYQSLLECTLTGWNFSDGSFSRVETGNIKNFSINDQHIYSAESYDEIKQLVKKNTILKNEYQESLEKYNKDMGEYLPIEEGIIEKIERVRRKYEEFKKLHSEFNNYMKLASGDFELAQSFFEKAYNVSEEAMGYIRSQYPVETIKN